MRSRLSSIGSWITLLSMVVAAVLAAAIPALASASAGVSVAQAVAITSQTNTCEMYPIALHGASLVDTAPGTTFDAVGGTRPGNFAWLTWTGVTGADVLAKSLTPPGDSSSYINPADTQDRVLSPGDWMRIQPGRPDSSKVRAALDELKTIDITVPLWDQVSASGGSAQYRAERFAHVRLLSYQLSTPRLSLRFLGFGGCGSAPVAENLSATTDEDTGVDLTLRAAQSGGATLQFVLGTPGHGSLGTPSAPVCTTAAAITTCESIVRYTPTADYHGADAFTYTAGNGSLTSAAASAAITILPINDAPTASASTITTAEDAATSITLGGVDVDADTLQFAVATEPTRGGLVTNGDGSLTYTPGANYHGADSFTFTASDGTLPSTPARVSIVISSVNDAPKYTGAAANTSQTIDEGQGLQPLAATDVDGDTLAFSIASGTLPGGITLASNGTFAGLAGSESAGDYSAVIAVADGKGGSAQTSLSITVEGTTGPEPEPEPVPNRPRGPVLAWGQNYEGQIGDASTDERRTPVVSNLAAEAVAVAAGENHTVALKADGTVWTWGQNDYLQLGIPDYGISTTPVQVAGLDNVVAVAAGYDHSLALTSDGTVWTWGRGDMGQLGTASLANSAVPAQVFYWGEEGAEMLRGVIAIAAGDHSNLALKGDGTAWAWGNNGVGQLGQGNTGPNISTALPVPGLADVASVNMGLSHALAVKRDGTVWAWGSNEYGQLGYSTATTGGLSSVPKQVPGIGNIAAAGKTIGLYSAVVGADGSVWTWGHNDFGQLGDDSQVHRMTPKAVVGLSNVSTVAGGRGHMIAVKRDGGVYTWGKNWYGQLGDGTTQSRRSPGMVGTAGTALAAAAGFEYSVIVQRDGSIPEPNPATCTPGFLRAQYIVVLKDDVANPQTVAADMAARLGVAPTLIYSTGLKGFAGTIPDASLAAVDSDPRVVLVDQDMGACVASTVGVTPAANNVPLADDISAKSTIGLQRIGGSTDGVRQTLPNKGSGVGVAVLDTGIDPMHEEVAPLAGGVTCVPDTTSPDDDNGHGTMAASIIGGWNDGQGVAGVAPEVSLYAVKVMDNSGWGQVSWGVCGVNWVTANAGSIKVANMSIRWDCDPGSATLDCRNIRTDPPSLQQAIRRSIEAGVTYIAASGNDGKPVDTIIPARFDEVITVAGLNDWDGRPGGTAYTNEDTLGSYSNYGSQVDIAAPGTDIVVAVPRKEPKDCKYCNTLGYGIFTGTSIAAPYVSGAAALYIEKHPSATPAEVRKHLLDTAEPGPIVNSARSLNVGVLNVRPPLLYVATSGQQAVLALDPDTLATRATIPVPGLAKQVALSPNRGYLYVTHGLDKSVSMIDATTNELIKTFPLDAEPHDVAVSRNSRWVFVSIDGNDANDTPISRVVVIDARAQAIHEQLISRSGTRGIAVHPDGTRVYAANGGWPMNGGSNILGIELAPGTQEPRTTTLVDRDIEFYGSLYPVVANDGMLYVDRGYGGLTSWNTTTGDVAIHDGGFGDVMRLAVHPDAKTLYGAVANGPLDNPFYGIMVVDTNALDSFPRFAIQTGALVSEIVLSLNGDRLYATAGNYDSFDQQVIVVDTKTMTIINTRSLSGAADGIAIRP